MANEQVFNNRADNYVKGRPGYANGVLELLFHDILKPNDKIADVGSGTGIFAKAFIERGFETLAPPWGSCPRPCYARPIAGD